MNVLVVDAGEGLPADTVDCLRSAGYQVELSTRYDVAFTKAQTWDYDAVVVPAPQALSDEHRRVFADLMRAVDLHGAAALVIGSNTADCRVGDHRLIEFADHRAGKEEIRGRLATILRYHRVVRAMERDLNNMQRLFKRLNIQFNEVDQEMRLAGRLQEEFLPKGIDTLGPVRFAALYRPASFVSGDIYDVFRVDEEHVGFYLADAVGHGMAASLLTMFIKNAVVGKRVFETHYELLDPGQTLEILNRKLLDQQLPNSQFVTACYGLLNTRTLELRYARAGHPYPLLHTAGGMLTDLKSPGGLLGLFADEEFPTQDVTLQPGDKLMFYSDGLETAFTAEQDLEHQQICFREALQGVAGLPAKRLVNELAGRLDGESGSVNPLDDETLLVMEVMPPS